MLPVDVTPQRGEALAGYLQRVATALGQSTSTLYDHLGLRVGGHTVGYLHVAQPESLRQLVADRLGRHPEDIAAMLLSSYPGLDLSALAGERRRGAHRDVQRSQWIFLSGTRYCPECVCTADGVWLNDWQLPWAYACVTHGQLLVSQCSRCGRRPDLVPRHGATDAEAPHRCPCGSPRDDTSGTCVDPTDMAAQSAVLDAARGAEGHLWGSRADGITRLAAWRAACTLAAAGAGVRWSRRPFLVPPPDAPTMAALVARAAPVLTAASVEDAVTGFDELMSAHHGHGEAIVWDHIPRISPLSHVAVRWLSRRGRAHAQLTRGQQHAFVLADVEPRVIPTLAAVHHLPRRWAAARLPAMVMRRAALSLATARLAGAGTWAEAGTMLGIDSQYAARLVRHTLRSIGGEAARELSEAAFDHARGLDDQSAPAARPFRGALASAASLRQFAAQVD